MNKVLVGVIATLCICSLFLFQRIVVLSKRMQEAAAVIELYESDKQLSNMVLKNQQEVENAIKQARKERESQLEGAACLTGDAHIEYLLRLLDEDYEARCGSPAGNAAR